MKYKLRASLILTTVVLLGACASLFGQRNVEVPLALLQEKMAERFPFNSRYLEIFDIHLSNPKLSLQPDTNRILTTVDASISPSFLKQGWTGSFTVSGRLTVDSERRALVLAEPRVENLNMPGLDNRYGQQVVRIGNLLAEEVLRNLPLYTFTEDKFRYAGTSFTPTKITTRNNGLVVTFEPVK